MMENFNRMVDRINEISRRFNIIFSPFEPPAGSVNFDDILRGEVRKLDKTNKIGGLGKDVRLEERENRISFSKSEAAYSGLVNYYSHKNGLRPELVDALIRIESNYDPFSRSDKGALGLMQLMPETAEEMGIEDPFDPEENIRGGTKYLRHLIDKFGGDLRLALAAYNAGPSAVDNYGGVPPFKETRDYVTKVLSIYRNSR